MNKNEFQNRYANHQLNQSEIDRKWKMYLREQEEMRMIMEAARAASISPILGGAGGSGLTTGPSWIADFSIDSESGDDYVAQSMAIDSSGNIYSLSYSDLSLEVSLLRKFSNEGALIWEQTLTSDASEFNGRPSRIRYSSYYNNLFVAYEGGIRAIDTDGAPVWESWIDGTASNLDVISHVIDSSGILYMITQDESGDTPCQIIQKRDGSNGGILKEISTYLDAPSSYINADIVLDSEGNLIVPIAYENVAGYGTLIIKFDSNLDGIWFTSIIETAYGGYDQDCTGFGIDSSNNVYVNGYGRGLTKIDANGNIVWALTISETDYGLGVDTNGNSYIVGDDEGLSSSGVRIFKFDPTGGFLWGYSVTGVSDPLKMSNWTGAYSKAQVFNDKLLVTAALINSSGPEVLLNLPLEAVTPGNYGDYVITDISETLVVTPRTPSNSGMTYTTSETESFITSTLTTYSVPIDQTIHITSL